MAHDWLVRYAGSERVVEEILRVFPDARLLTTVVDAAALPPSLRRAHPSVLQRVPRATRIYPYLLPAMPAAWRLRRPIRDVDVVISSSHSCAKAVRIARGIPHLCYCHTPMRYAWEFDTESTRVPAAARPLAAAGMAWFRRWDRATADNVDAFVANSSEVADRIRRYYGRKATVIHPPVDVEFFTPGGERGDYFLYAARLVGYKRPDIAVDAFAGLEHRLVVVGEGPLRAGLEQRRLPNVTFRDEVSADELRGLYRGARAFLHPAKEDFGIAMAEAQACGTPVIALDIGGARDIVADGVTGWLLPTASPAALADAVRTAASTPLDAAEIRRRAERFSAARFRAELAGAVDELLSRSSRGRGRR